MAASARSIKGFDLYAALEACSEHLIQFGGHMHAAGMTCLPEKYEDFKFPSEIKLTKTIHDILEKGKQADNLYYKKDHQYYPELEKTITSKDTIFLCLPVINSSRLTTLCQYVREGR